ncbi:glucosamine/fructose-6-phosphate aminotransferase, isomerizing [Gordonia bronchialis DSM 43247]|uniref:Glutamine--fructose-6-phosphate aminotransferase [isomerizing] n=1 Tax=Gordonia bronchialis (strain ATCC 25592 / DSM 43247 / BCRC 13721 / JCM 3198 / KCTC 3076 / NBRC 16047 / NCTC 10667) TaxID=526226 RepID=D0L7V8_GORB4|nr:glutamine--fructose-6-phosphate transaminase (isomerizing) [Gordonia bronchialis]ACY20971.1 glucosamine/fructose-6-phosphate aminotransferase, isomerizing [Gordonia bronchialis DSM 43247]MCC3323747.1 glutamine--fructose-6-phosphate transaminase (isomerizing) [Gordonia bronchialis]QGS25308.1 glutamine--fructose-6-phosphate transaminase (isomerizing) [Gordonia bronchialis]STQ63824.1 Glucosamine--fructose-6-phosphate aminotransferase [isomerizing] [Gordonia bronchialis]
MCGIIGYVGQRDALDIVVEALRRMEYRGYDSAGVAILDGQGHTSIQKRAGRLENLDKQIATVGRETLAGSTGMGHTRWATHGKPTDRNAHPHSSTDGKIAVVHNGIIENYAVLRTELEESGIEFTSDTDTETAVHLLEREYASGAAAGDFVASAYAALRRLEGAFTLVFTHSDHPGTIVAARRSTPLVVGVGTDEMFVSSDVTAFIEHTRDAVELGQDEVVVITANTYEITDFDGNPRAGKPFHINWDLAAAEKSGYDFFMLKEIAEQPRAIADTLLGHLEGGRIVLDEQRLTDQDLRDVDKVFVVACGTAYHAGLLAKYAIEHWTRLPVEVELASEFRYRDPVLDRSTLVVAISQSGETADTLEAVRHAKDQKARVLAICNTNGAQIPRESDAVLYTHAGPEIGVASTKCFLAQIAAAYLVGLALAQARGTKYADEVAREFAAMEAMADAVAQVLGTMEPVRDLARSLAHHNTVLFIGRHVGYPVALEGALKLKELAYMHAEGFAAGELKHGPIALIEDDLPVIIVMPSAQGRAVLHSKMVSNIREIQARGARTIVIAEADDTAARAVADEFVEIPKVPTLLQPLVTTVPLQVFAASVAQARGYDVDKPRNLAKSVTVE